jgi:hypothetical protein
MADGFVIFVAYSIFALDLMLNSYTHVFEYSNISISYSFIYLQFAYHHIFMQNILINFTWRCTKFVYTLENNIRKNILFFKETNLGKVK